MPKLKITFRAVSSDTILLQALVKFYADNMSTQFEKEGAHHYFHVTATFSSRKSLNAVLAYCKDNHMDVTIVEEKKEII